MIFLLLSYHFPTIKPHQKDSKPLFARGVALAQRLQAEGWGLSTATGPGDMGRPHLAGWGSCVIHGFGRVISEVSMISAVEHSVKAALIIGQFGDWHWILAKQVGIRVATMSISRGVMSMLHASGICYVVIALEKAQARWIPAGEIHHGLLGFQLPWRDPEDIFQ